MWKQRMPVFCFGDFWSSSESIDEDSVDGREQVELDSDLIEGIFFWSRGRCSVFVPVSICVYVAMGVSCSSYSSQKETSYNIRSTLTSSVSRPLPGIRTPM